MRSSESSSEKSPRCSSDCRREGVFACCGDSVAEWSSGGRGREPRSRDRRDTGIDLRSSESSSEKSPRCSSDCRRVTERRASPGAGRTLGCTRSEESCMMLRRLLDLRRLGSVAWLSSSPAHADASPLQLKALRRVLRVDSARLRAESDLVSSTSTLHELCRPPNRLQVLFILLATDRGTRSGYDKWSQPLAVCCGPAGSSGSSTDARAPMSRARRGPRRPGGYPHRQHILRRSPRRAAVRILW